METVTDFLFLGSKITVDSGCSHEIKRPLLLGGKSMTNIDSILKKQTHFADRVAYSQSYVFSSHFDGYERVGRLSTEKLMLSNCGAGKYS